MWISFNNLNCGDPSESVKGDEPREAGSILCEPRSVIFRPTMYGKQAGWIVVVTAEYGADPKLHFLDEQKAKDCYAYLAGLIPGGAEHDFVEVDALAMGGI